MKFKKTIPYTLAGMGLVFSGYLHAQGDQPGETVSLFPEMPKIEVQVPSQLTATVSPTFINIDWASDRFSQLVALDRKAGDLVHDYIDRMLNALGRLNPLLGTKKYRAAVRRELPGASVGAHCVYGQYTHLFRALADRGDTLTLIPKSGSSACIQFMNQMRQKYDTFEYRDAIHEGRMFESDAAYAAARDKYMASHGVTDDTPDSVRFAVAAGFESKNFAASELNPGTMLVVPRYRGSKTKFHMIMFLGRGRVENGKFVADPAGRYIYTGHNRENIGDLFGTYDTSRVFAADTKTLARVAYTKEWKNIAAMPREALIDYLMRDGTKDRVALNALSRTELLRLARDQYFKSAMPGKARGGMTPQLIAMNAARNRTM